MNFDHAFIFVVGIEGGYTNDPNDPGGETKFGISKRAYPQVDIPNLTLDEAKAIYLRDYWHVCKCDELPADMALLVFDAAVNQGVSAALRFYANATTAEGYQAERALAYARLSTFPTYGRGWMRRLFTTFRAALR